MSPADSGGAYSFRPMLPTDLPLARRWLETPEVRRWWGDPDEQLSLLAGDLAEPGMRMWIVSHGGRPFAYVQDYDPRSWGLQPFKGVPTGARGIDPFIGEPDMLNLGHGSAFLGAHTARLFAERAPAAFIDPDPGNARAIRAYEKAGFTPLGETTDSEGHIVLVMLARAPQGTT